eukprot:TRINITY_DN8534_c1_g1_i1.p1 TRINITY_DN8534_c1_g1~~TRINITY_DN8534_c1_g1_i1.p1  ORF type:complete len:103 (-),score=5.21 TRINITY_DN8534_c1_g1_i1:826-1134(-)
MNVKNVILHGDLQEEVYMRLPQGNTSTSKNDVARLRRSLYGLKQAPRAWFEKFRSTMLHLGFARSPYNPSLFTNITPQGTTLLLVYVDIIITDTNSNMIHDL